jgi:hypothetical protein
LFCQQHQDQASQPESHKQTTRSINQYSKFQDNEEEDEEVTHPHLRVAKEGIKELPKNLTHSCFFCIFNNLEALSERIRERERERERERDSSLGV